MAIRRKKIENPEESPFLKEEAFEMPETDKEIKDAVPESQEKEEREEEGQTEKVGEGGDYPKKRRSYWEFGLLIAVGLIVVVAIGALVFLAVKNTKRADGDKVSIQNISEEIIKEDAESEPEKKTEPEEVSKKNEVEVSKSVNFFDTAVKILNGGAAGGSAGKMKDLLASKGYKKIEAGNSNSSTYSGTTIFYQSEAKAAAEKILADIKSKYPSAQVKIASSSEEKSSAIVIILGK